MKRLFLLAVTLFGFSSANLAWAGFEEDAKDCPEIFTPSGISSADLSKLQNGLATRTLGQIEQALQTHRDFTTKRGEDSAFRNSFALQRVTLAPVRFRSFSGDTTLSGEIVYSIGLDQVGDSMSDRFDSLFSCDHAAKVARLIRVDIVRSSTQVGSPLQQSPIRYNIGVRYDSNGKMHFSHAAFGR